MHNDKFNGDYIKFINENFTPREHLFIFVADAVGEMFPIPRLANVKKLFCSRKRFYNYLRLLYYCVKADKIILHGLFVPQIVKFLYINRYLMKKCYWIIWGGDFQFVLENKNNSYENNILTNVQNIACLTNEENNLYAANFKKLTKIFNVTYLNPITKVMLDNARCECHDSINILIGNSATESNNHKEIFDLLSRHQNENIKIYVPLSYGEQIYAQEIIRYGTEKLGDKFIPVLNFFAPNDYANFLQHIDIAVFNNIRQQSLGNIYALLYLNKKIFIRNDCPTWGLLEGYHLKIYDVFSLANLSFNNFIARDELINENCQIAEDTFYSVGFVKSQWSDVFMNAS